MTPTDEDKSRAIEQGAKYLTRFSMQARYGLQGYRWSREEPKLMHNGAVEVINLDGRKTILQNCSVLIDQVA
jgi:hypothetical protein